MFKVSNRTDLKMFLGAIKVLRNADGGGGVSEFPEKSVTKVQGSTLFSVTRGWVGVQFPGKKRYVTLEWPLTGSISLACIGHAAFFF